MKRVRIDWLLVVTALFFAYGCGGGCGGCAGMEPIPGGFPAAERTPNAGQVRITQSAIAKVTADPAGVLGPLAGAGATNGVIDFPIPPSCGGNPSICCPNGQPSATCGPMAIDLNQQTGDAARLAITPVQSASRVDVTIRARVKTRNPLPITYSGIDCTVSIDTTRSSPADLRVDLSITFTQDPTTGTTRVTASNTAVTQIDSGDISLGGGFLCSLGGTFISLFIGTLTDQIAGQIEDTVNSSLCKACDTGSVAECGTGATACTNNTCMIDTRCMQELGLDGRMRGSTLFASLSPGTTGAMDLYEVAGGYATTNNNGIALGLLGGMVPAGAARDHCGPPATPPPAVTVPLSNYFQGNTRPDTGTPFDVGIGLHKSQLADLAYAGYDGGLFCLTIGSSAFEQLSTDTISLLSRSLGKLVEQNSPMAVGIRPQSPPTITLGKNTFKDDGSGNMIVDVPLLDISFKALEIDFFASIDEQWIRVFTVVADVHLPIGIQTTSMGELAPVIGNPMDAFTNISVKNNEAITETPEELAGLFPTLLSLVLPQLSGGLSPISLPALGGLALSVTAVTAVDNDNFLAIYANLVPAPMARTVDTKAVVVGVAEPPDAIMRDVKRWRSDAPPSVTLAFSSTMPNVEYSYRIDSGAWSAWSKNAQPTITSRVFWLGGLHRVDVRSREIGHPETLDLEPAVLEVPIGRQAVPLSSNFHGQSGGGGCSCETGRGGAGWLVVLVIGLMLLSRRALRRFAWHARRIGAVVWLAAVACLPGCSCGNPCGDVECLPGDVEHGGGGRWTSIASDQNRVLVASYETMLGDLVVVDATDISSLKYVVADGVPPDVKPTHDPDTYRGGIEDAGPNVGAWTSVAVYDGKGYVAYQDRDEGTLKFAFESDKNKKWDSYVLDADDVETGRYASMIIDADHHPVVAYLAIGVDDNSGHRLTELRLKRAGSSNPGSSGDWASALIAAAPGSCGGLCGSDQCVVGVMPTDAQECVVPQAGCTCADTEACVAGVCREKVNEPKVVSLPGGTGLYVSLVVLPDGRLAATYYDMSRRALVISVENSKNTGAFTESILDGNVVGSDRGMWTAAVVGSDGTVHIAYQDALGDQLMYTTWNNAPGTPEIVDDGQRPNDRTHPVGAGGAIYLANGAPVILYQDGLKADVSTAARNGTSWALSSQSLPTLDGFSIGVTTGHGSPVAAWGQLDPTLAPPHKLVVSTPP